MLKVISSGLSPNTKATDVIIALEALILKRHWKDPLQLHILKKWFASRYNSDQVYLFNSGRSALYFLLKAAGVTKQDEVIVQAFTCIGAINPIIWIGAKPVYIDIDPQTYNLDPDLLESSITSKTKVVIVQHTFGIPAAISKIKKICQEHKIILIEDCAVSIGAFVGKKEVGTYGDAAFFSFGRDKIVSSVSGGAAIINNLKHFANLDELYREILEPSSNWVYQQLLHPVAMAVILPLYLIQVGKILLVLLQKIKLISKPYEELEYSGGKPESYPRRYSPALVPLIMHQLRQLDAMDARRVFNASYYGENLIKGAVYLRYPVLVKNREQILNKAQRAGIYLGTWYDSVINPAGVTLSNFKYKKGSCPVAEDIAGRILNLPTYARLTVREIKKVRDIVND
ncbi:hypothetical protein COW99_01515 [Candidatus Roizmanbacteria bacterium CG22_combo_CG10-13_8_21_14_all_38_20]|uniref:DegT/DnrJ/EryC1/StrS aminotransferase n=1 Tax=Candidatus Roizmanbacteria bacterium CG22_combo_CG10-13_8_21_14_all_38_20 TaxID=1974862 RepID=A0A2H0BW24_9BACT|nr:aminotransferase class I/II-fold pyridoxal phosphate-dependent enzyme [Candidatus Microgenomates bacterium]PIP61883.1 MAG: hypothetical protein COW99_01515 [Candidatus Roizmanbacteria bacterium CG22_combo_CG10-13_8_21_14_all_38_20]PJC32142.1 MAG: hypothetical protein CO050_01440 [Candidatus Roizmanbacteria bacterium CG_4_9_14_0_2_um_filter_38_17]